MSIVNRCTAMALVLCVCLGVVPVGAEEAPGVLRPDAEPTPFFLLPDRALGSFGPENEENAESVEKEETKKKSRDWLGLGRDSVFLLSYQFDLEDRDINGFAEASRSLGDHIEYGLNIGWRAADGLEDVARGRLLLERLRLALQGLR